jgi:hypothetical protein
MEKTRPPEIGEKMGGQRIKYPFKGGWVEICFQVKPAHNVSKAIDSLSNAYNRASIGIIGSLTRLENLVAGPNQSEPVEILKDFSINIEDLTLEGTLTIVLEGRLDQVNGSAPAVFDDMATLVERCISDPSFGTTEYVTEPNIPASERLAQRATRLEALREQYRQTTQDSSLSIDRRQEKLRMIQKQIEVYGEPLLPQ